MFALAQAKDGTIVAGTSHGIFALDPGVAGDPRRMAAAQHHRQHRREDGNRDDEAQAGERGEAGEGPGIPNWTAAVNALDFSGDVWLASTSVGLLTSRDQGASWQGGPVMGRGRVSFRGVQGADDGRGAGGWAGPFDGRREDLVAAGAAEGAHAIRRVAFSPDGTLWLGAREGIYFSRDMGRLGYGWTGCRFAMWTT